MVAVDTAPRTPTQMSSSEGYTELAEEASRVLPDPVDINQLEVLGIQHGLTRDDLISRMGGSP